MPPRIALICVGSELLRGKINTHASTIARRLSALGLALRSERTVGDNLEEIAEAIRRAIGTSDVALVTGGLGPTFDDVTREAAAKATGRRLVLSKVLLNDIQKKFHRAGHKRMAPANQRQAYLLEGATAIANSVGTAPGQYLKTGSTLLIILPGPPSELEPMLDRVVLPRLKKMFEQGAHAEAHCHYVGVPESVIDHKVRPIISKEKGADFTILARPGLVDLDIFVHAANKKVAAGHLERIVKAVKKKTGSCCYGMDDESSLERVIKNRLLSRKETLAVAESCTGGLLSKRLTDVEGSSHFFLSGVITYANSAKSGFLGVPEETLKTVGAVSKETAVAMAIGVRMASESTWGVSITGIAGPGGGTPKKPVGLVFIAVSNKSATRCKEFHFRGSRLAIRERAALAAMNMLREFLL